MKIIHEFKNSKFSLSHVENAKLLIAINHPIFKFFKNKNGLESKFC